MPRLLVAGVALVLAGAGGAAPPASASLTAAPATSTTLALSTSESAYGQTVRATATVVATTGPAEGDVLFSVDGAAVKAT